MIPKMVLIAFRPTYFTPFYLKTARGHFFGGFVQFFSKPHGGGCIKVSYTSFRVCPLSTVVPIKTIIMWYLMQVVAHRHCLAHTC